MARVWKIGELGEGTVEKLAFGGKGIVRHEDFIIFVLGAIPGQKVRFQIRKKEKNFATAKLIQVLEKSPLEIESPYPSMPGCSLQKIPYPEQLRIKEEQVFEALRHVGNISTAETFEKLPILPSPEIFRYRNRVEFSYGYESMKVETAASAEKIFYDENPCLGFHPEGKWNLVQPISDCFLISEKLNRIKNCAEEIMQDSEMPVYNSYSHKGFWKNLLLRESRKNGAILVNFLVTQKQDASFWQPHLQKLCAEFPEITGILSTIQASENDKNPAIETLWGHDFLVEYLEDIEFFIPPFSFFQTNTLGAEQLFRVVREFAELQGSENILDLFCGSGAIGLFLAKQAKSIVGVEMDAAAISEARENARRNNISGTYYFCGAAEKILPEVLAEYINFEVIILDPPRAGLHPKALQLVGDITATTIIYVSCNPATLARDIKELKNFGWQLQKVQPVDMFPHTPHIEVVVKLQKTPAP